MVQDSGASSLQFGISGCPISYEAIFFTIGWCKFFHPLKLFQIKLFKKTVNCLIKATENVNVAV